MKLRLFDKPTRLVIHAGAGRHIAAETLFGHLRDALDGQSLDGVTIITVHGDGSVSLDRDGLAELVYRPRIRAKG